MNSQFRQDRNFTTSEVAEYFDQSDQTIRSWSDRMAQYLSSYATNTDGRNRTYKIEDIQILKFVAVQRHNGIKFEVINDLIRDAIDDAVDTTSLPNVTRENVEQRLELNEYSIQEFQIQLLLDEIADQARELEKLRPKDKEVTELHIRLDERDRIVEQLSKRIEILQREVVDAARREGNAYYRGRYDAIIELKKDKSDTSVLHPVSS